MYTWRVMILDSWIVEESKSLRPQKLGTFQRLISVTISCMKMIIIIVIAER